MRSRSYRGLKAAVVLAWIALAGAVVATFWYRSGSAGAALSLLALLLLWLMRRLIC